MANIVATLHGLPAIPWAGRPAFFERASGLVFVHTNRVGWEAFGRAATDGTLSAGQAKLLERLLHEFYHYLQFFGCGYVTEVCAAHFKAVKQGTPHPFTPSSIAEFFASPPVRPAALENLSKWLTRRGESGLTPLQIVEGCAHLFQHLEADPALIHGKYLTLLGRCSEPYRGLYNKVTLALRDRALRETLFIGTCALEFAAPEDVFDDVLRANAELDSLGPGDDIQERRRYVVERVDNRFGYLGTAADLVKAGLYHPLLRYRWIFSDSPDWTTAITTALYGRSDRVLAACINQAPVVMDDAVHCPPAREDQSRDDYIGGVQTLVILGRLSLHFSDSLREAQGV